MNSQTKSVDLPQMGKLTIFITFLLLISLRGSGQGSGNAKLSFVPPASPEAATLGKFINYPVSYNAGLPDISVPLYEIKAGDITIPITLSYHASGNKVNDKGSWVGLGWSLQINPIITRKLNGFNDEGGYLANTLLGTGQTGNQFYKERIMNGDGLTDEDPDDFYYSLLGKSGRFNYRKDCLSCSTHGISTFPYTQDKIADLGNMIFDVTDENGIYYRFGQSLSGASTVEHDLNGVNINSKVTEIISSTSKDTVYFKYENHPTYIRTGGTNDYFSIELPENKTIFYMENLCDGRPTYKSLISEAINGTLRRKYISVWDQQQYEFENCPTYISLPGAGNGINDPKMLKYIYFPGGYLEITGTPTRLERIRIHDGNGGVAIKEFKFNLSNNSASNGRNLLNSVEIMDGNGSPVQKYQFSYSGGFAVPDTDPHTDHWGYYNGSVNPISMGMNSTPSVNVTAAQYDGFNLSYLDFVAGSAIKDANLLDTQNGVLTSITFPTGGKTEFTYELNRYIDMQDQISDAGGLRIAGITEYDEQNHIALKRLFKYGINENGAGYIKDIPDIEDYLKETYKTYFPNHTGNMSLNTTRQVKTWYSQPVVDLFHAQGAPVLYPEVAEYIYTTDPITYEPVFEVGKTVYKYNVEPMRERGQNYDRLLNLEYKNDSWQYGELLEKTQFKSTSSGFQEVEKTEFTFNFRFYPSLGVYVGKNAPKSLIDGDPSLYPSDYRNYIYVANLAYTDIPGFRYLQTEKKTVFDGAVASVVTDRKYFYDNASYTWPTSIMDVCSNKDTLVTFNQYPQDIGPSSLISKNMLSTLIFNWTQINKPNGSKFVTDGSKRDYRYEGGIVLLDKIHQLEIKEPLSLSSFNFSGDSHLKERTAFLKYSDKGRLKEFRENEGIINSIFWGYKNTRPVAQVVNASYDAAKLYVDEAYLNRYDLSTSQIDSETQKLRTNLPNSFVTTFSYNPLIGITSQTDAKGMTTYYEYDNFRRLKHIKDQNGNIVKSYDYHYKP
jgi:YD repeat-containing protein